MSTADIHLLGPPQADDLYNPEFAVVLRGYDPEEVRSYVQNVATHMESLQRQLQDAREEVEAGRRQYLSAREAAYRQLGSQMAELLHTADLEAERLKREGVDEAARKTSEAERLSHQLRREAEDHAEGLRLEGEETLWRARAETDRILGGLAIKRDETLKELEATRGRLRAVMASLETTITVTREEAMRSATAASEVEERAHSEVEALEPPSTFAAPTDDIGRDGDRTEAEDVAIAPEAMATETDSASLIDVAFDIPEGTDPDRAVIEAAATGETADSDAPRIWESPPRAPSSQRADMLDSVEGFDLVLPDVRIDEDGEVSQS